MTLSLKGSSRLSLVATRVQLEKLISSSDPSVASKVSADLLAIVTVLDSSIAPRRDNVGELAQSALKIAASWMIYQE